jgi:hypothetical protein
MTGRAQGQVAGVHADAQPDMGQRGLAKPTKVKQLILRLAFGGRHAIAGG